MSKTLDSFRFANEGETGANRLAESARNNLHSSITDQDWETFSRSKNNKADGAEPVYYRPKPVPIPEPTDDLPDWPAI
ncbi:MAG TPA: hypothetical protein V6D17_05825 [Candidatus Obscuribacterales bacterium]